ncbi:MAG: bifunctional transaldolase/phosoglucose isomerase [bacterium]
MNALRMTWRLPDAEARDVAASLDAWERAGNTARLWARDAALWTGTDEAAWLGWLDIVEAQRDSADRLANFALEVRRDGFTHAILLGMGGSSLAPEVFAMTFGRVAGAPALSVLDSTDPAQVRAAEAKVDLARTLFIVSSKSGSTLEPNVFRDYFLDRARQTLGAAKAAEHFVAITDPGSQLERFAQAEGFRRIFPGVPTIGGRYSALSHFGTVPAAVMGVDVAQLLDRADEMARACGASVAANDNAGVALGVALGVMAARHRRDKLTVIASPGVHDLGAWLEQLIAESTGKHGAGIIPVDREALGDARDYGSDRVFAYLRLAGAADAAQDRAADALERAGQPVIRIALRDAYDLGAEFFRWEIATAVAGAILQINPFDQPDVEASKIATRGLTSAYETSGALPDEAPILDAEGIALYADARNAAAILDAVSARRADAGAATGDGTLVAALRAHLARLAPGDYFALLAYIEMNDAHERALQTMRIAVRNAKGVATCLGFGPRFLHSTGQAYKGGPASGVFLQITCDDAHDLAIPGARYTFGIVKAAQARGDFAVLAERERRALRVHLGADVAGGLARLGEVIARALA